MEMKFREAGHSSQLLEFHLAIQIPTKIVDDPINSLGVLTVRLDLFAWHGLYGHGVAGRDNTLLRGVLHGQALARSRQERWMENLKGFAAFFHGTI